MIETITNLEQLHGFAEKYVSELSPHTATATVVGLSGDLGSGKTAFVQCVARALGVTEHIVSPTFVLAKYYDLAKKPWGRLIHIDCYRLEDPEELQVLGWEALLADPSHLVLIEWPEKIGARFPSDARMLQFLFINETTRQVSY